MRKRKIKRRKMRSKHRSSTSVLKVDPLPEKIEFRRYNRTKRDIKTHRRKERKERTRTSEIKRRKKMRSKYRSSTSVSS
jgi:hypothetical protein